MPPKLIAEYKRKSPWAGPISDVPLFEAIPYMNLLRPSMISIVVDPAWGGSYDDIRVARRFTALPILAKGRSVDESKAIGLGANYVLKLPGRIPSPYAVWECHYEHDVELARCLEGMLLLNNRDIHTGNEHPGTVDSLLPLVPKTKTVIAASGYNHPDDAPIHADYVLIGERLWRKEKPII